eukprot:jgi/Psemu1/5365/gm1.5365_g
MPDKGKPNVSPDTPESALFTIRGNNCVGGGNINAVRGNINAGDSIIDDYHIISIGASMVKDNTINYNRKDCRHYPAVKSILYPYAKTASSHKPSIQTDEITTIHEVNATQGGFTRGIARDENKHVCFPRTLGGV